MKITKLEAIPYDIPYVTPLKFASGEVHAAQHVLLKIHTDEGITGIADAPPRPYTYGETQVSIKNIIEEIFAPQIIGLDPFDREKVRTIMHRTINNQVAKGTVDIALWDIAGKAMHTPVHKILGGFTDSLRVSHMLGFKSAPELVEEAQQFQDIYGITTFKLKVGRHPLSEDVEACRALIENLDGVEIYLDANRGWSANEAMEVLRQIQDLPITLFEEPCDAKEKMSRRRLVEHSRIPIVGDESVPTAGDAAAELLSGGCNAICIKTARSGFTEATEILGLCTGLGIDVTMGNQIDTQLGSLATVTFGAAHQASSARAGELSNFLDMSDDLLAEPLQIKNGRIHVRDTPGVGAEIDEEKLNHYRTDSYLPTLSVS